ncbi:MAG: hypothetical protein ACR2N4_01375 [Jatrophihabitans sp.]
MTPARDRTAQQRDARELALTPPADPYRGGLCDPFAAPPTRPVTDAGPSQPAGSATSGSTDGTATGAGTGTGTGLAVGTRSGRGRSGTPPAASFAAVLGIVLGLTVGLFGMLLLTILSLQDQYSPDRSFYQGTDSGYVVLALVDFGVAAASAIGGIALLTGRLGGRVAMTIAGWTTLMLSGFWWLRSSVNAVAPLVLALATATMLVLCYQQAVTRWLGIVQPPQPD